MRRTVRRLLGWSTVALLSFPPLLPAQTLAVENVRFTQDDSVTVTVTYNLAGDPGKKYAVLLSLYIPSSRQKVPIPDGSLSGAAGPHVQPGKNLKIVWHLKKDFPKGLEGPGFRFIVDVYQERRAGLKWPWLVAGLAAAGGAAVLLSGASRPAPPVITDLPAPPVLPGRR